VDLEWHHDQGCLNHLLSHLELLLAGQVLLKKEFLRESHFNNKNLAILDVPDVCILVLELELVLFSVFNV